MLTLLKFVTSFKALTLLAIASTLIIAIFASSPATVVDTRFGAQGEGSQTNTHNEHPTANNNSAEQAPSNAAMSDLTELPDSLKNVFVKPALLTDDAGNLIITDDLKQLFDAFLSLNTQESIEQIRARIEQYIHQALSGDARQQALDVLDGYLAFKFALYEGLKNGTLTELPLNQSGLNMQDLANHLEAQRALRAKYFSAETIEAFFSEQDALDNFTLARLNIETDSSLSANEKQHALSVLEANTSPDIIESRKQADPISNIRQQEQKLREQGATAEDIHAYRVTEMGVEAADRYAELDAERSQWQQRLADYESAKQAILDEAGLSADEKQNQIKTLQDTSFNSRELMRVKAHERRQALVANQAAN